MLQWSGLHNRAQRCSENAWERESLVVASSVILISGCWPTHEEQVRVLICCHSHISHREFFVGETRGLSTFALKESRKVAERIGASGALQEMFRRETVRELRDPCRSRLPVCC